MAEGGGSVKTNIGGGRPTGPSKSTGGGMSSGSGSVNKPKTSSGYKKNLDGMGGNGVHTPKMGGGGAELGGDRGAEYRSKGKIHDLGKPKVHAE